MDRKRTLKYLLITFIFTWVLWLGDAALVKFTAARESDLLPMILFTVGGFGPTIAALCCRKERGSLRGIAAFLFRCSGRSVPVLLLFIVLEGLTFGLSSMQRNPQIADALLPVVLLQAVFLYGGNEEPGWRGTLQPELQQGLSYPVATLCTGVIWSVWHLPLWLIEGNSHQGSSFVVFALLAILLCFWFSAIKNSGGSVFFCMVVHGLTNTLLSAFVIKVNWVLLLGLAVMTALAVVISQRSLRRAEIG